MKQTTYKLLVFLLLIPILIFAKGPKKGKYTETKTITNSFKVTNDTSLKIYNSYGNVDISSWDRNTIEIEVVISVSGNDEDKVNDKLDQIHIKFNANSNEVTASTHNEKSNSWFSSSWFNWKSDKLSYEINYKVKMPISNDLFISNDYGNILINELDGKADINCDFGKMIIGSLNHPNNKLSFDYTKSTTIEFINGGTINADFSGFTIEKANQLKLNADYSSSNIETIKELDFNCDFGSITVEKADHIDGNGDYLTMKFGEIAKEIEITADFGSIKIEHLKDTFEKVKIVADYTGVRIGIDKNASCNIISKLEYGSFKYEGDQFTFNKKKEKSTSKYYEGYFGNTNTNATITTTTDFGSVKLITY